VIEHDPVRGSPFDALITRLEAFLSDKMEPSIRGRLHLL